MTYQQNPPQQNPVAQYLQQILQSRKHQSTIDPSGAMPIIQSPVSQQPNQQPQQNQQQPDPVAGMQSISNYMGYKPNTTMGYDMSGMASQPQGPTQSGAPMQNPSMNLQQAMGTNPYDAILKAFWSMV